MLVSGMPCHETPLCDLQATFRFIPQALWPCDTGFRSAWDGYFQGLGRRLRRFRGPETGTDESK